MYVCSLEKCRSIHLEDFISRFLTHLSGENVRVASFGVVGAFANVQDRMIFSCAGSEFSLTYQSHETGGLELSREALRSFRWRDSEVSEEREFEFATPSIEYGFKVMMLEQEQWRRAGILAFAGNLVGQFESPSILMPGDSVLAYPCLVVFADHESSLGRRWTAAKVFLKVCPRNYLRLDFVVENGVVSATGSECVKDSDVLGVEISLGSLEMTVGQLLAIREGAIIRFHKPDILTGCVKLAGGVLAEVEVCFSDSTVELLVSRLEY